MTVSMTLKVKSCLSNKSTDEPEKETEDVGVTHLQPNKFNHVLTFVDDEVSTDLQDCQRPFVRFN